MIRIWIGTEEKTNLACKTLEHSILTRTKEQVKFFKNPGDSWIKRKTSEGTGFSLQRWLIPEFFNFEGRAIYLDADMLCFTDINNFWEMKLNSSIACTYQKDKWFEDAPASSTMLIDCAKAKEFWKYSTQVAIYEFLKNDTKRAKYISLMHAELCDKPQRISTAWNRFNKPIEPTFILHYTKEPEQPWYSPKHKHRDLWATEFVSALKSGYISRSEVEIELTNYQAHTCCIRGRGLHSYWKKYLQYAIK